MTVRRAVCGALGVLLIVLGLAGWHVQVGAVVIGAVAVGLVSGDGIVELVRDARGPQRDRDADSDS